MLGLDRGGVGMLSAIFVLPCSEAQAIVVHGSDLAVSLLLFDPMPVQCVDIVPV